MPSLFKQYHQALFDAPRVVNAGSSINTPERVYFETRKYKRSGDLFNEDRRTRTYRGRLMIEAKCMVLNGPHALAAAIIVWECEEVPEPPAKVSAKKAHRGVAGCLERNVYCKIAQAYQNLPQG